MSPTSAGGYAQILERHRGPFLFCILRAAATKKNAGAVESEWLKTPTEKEDVVEEALALLEDPRDGIVNVGLWSEGEQAFVTTFRREDASYIREQEARTGRVPDLGNPLHVAPDAGGGAVVPPASDGDGRGDLPGGPGDADEGDAPDPQDAGRGHAPAAAKPAARGSSYRVAAGAKDPAVRENAMAIWRAFKARGRATVAEVVEDVRPAVAVDDLKALVASYATKFKAAGLLVKE